MPARARIVTNPATGEDLTWLTSRRPADGAPVRARLRVFGAGRGAREPQVHATGAKRFTVLRGRLAILRDGGLSVLEAGETITVAAGVEHAWWSTRAGELCVEIEAAPEAFGLPPAAPARAPERPVPRRMARALRCALAV